MTINDGIRFVFDNCSSDEMGVMMVNSIGSTSMSGGDEKTNIITSKSPFKETHDLHYVSYDEPLQFTIILLKTDETYINADDERRIKKWLCKKTWGWLQIDQDDLSDVFYQVLIHSPEKINIGAYSGGLQFTVQSNCHHAWSRLYKKVYKTASGTLNVNLNFNFDYDEYILYPQLSIKSLSPTAQNITIKNNTTNETLSISGCTLNEEILIDCKTDQLKSSTNRVLLNDWNKNMVSMIEGVNNINLTGNFQVEISYRLPIRVGG